MNKSHARKTIRGWPAAWYREKGEDRILVDQEPTCRAVELTRASLKKSRRRTVHVAVGR